MARLPLLLLPLLALPLLAGCQDTNTGFAFIDQLQAVGEGVQPRHEAPHRPDTCPADQARAGNCR